MGLQHLSRNRNRGRSILGVTAVLAAAALAVSACGSSSTSSGGGSSAGVQSLTVVTPNLDPDSIPQLYLAQDLGYFTQTKVNVKRIDGVAAGALPLLTAGKADLIIQGSTSGFQLVAKGMDVSLIWSGSGGGTLGSVAVRSDSPYQSLDDLGGKKVGTVGTTGSQYGFANLYSAEVKDAGKSAFNIVPLADPATMINSLKSGSVEAANGSVAMFKSEVDAGRLRLLASTADQAQREKLLGGAYTADTGITGIKKNLQGKREAVVRFLEALDMANSYLTSHTPQEISAVLAKDPLFKALTPDSILAKMTAAVPFRTPYNGAISEDLWKTSLDVFRRWGLPSLGNLTDSKYSYSAIVDMSYLNDARSRIGKS